LQGEPGETSGIQAFYPIAPEKRNYEPYRIMNENRVLDKKQLVDYSFNSRYRQKKASEIPAYLCDYAKILRMYIVIRSVG